MEDLGTEEARSRKWEIWGSKATETRFQRKRTPREILSAISGDERAPGSEGSGKIGRSWD